MSEAAMSLARKELADLRERFARDEISVEELEDETNFWLKVETCDHCGPMMCASHYNFMYSYGMQ